MSCYKEICSQTNKRGIVAILLNPQCMRVVSRMTAAFVPRLASTRKLWTSPRALAHVLCIPSPRPGVIVTDVKLREKQSREAEHHVRAGRRGQRAQSGGLSRLQREQRQSRGFQRMCRMGPGSHPEMVCVWTRQWCHLIDGTNRLMYEIGGKLILSIWAKWSVSGSKLISSVVQ